MQPGFGQPPVALDSCWRDSENLSRLLDAQSPEISQLHDPALLRIQAVQAAESIVQCDQIHLAAATHFTRVFETDQALSGSPLGSPARTRMIDEYFAHHMGGYGDKPSAVLPFRIRLPREPEISFIDQRRGLQRM